MVRSSFGNLFYFTLIAPLSIPQSRCFSNTARIALLNRDRTLLTNDRSSHLTATAFFLKTITLLANPQNAIAFFNNDSDRHNPLSFLRSPDVS